MYCSICGKPLDFFYPVNDLTLCDDCATMSVAELAGAGHIEIVDMTVESADSNEFGDVMSEEPADPILNSEENFAPVVDAEYVPESA